MAHIRQSRPDSGLVFQSNVLRPFYDVPSSLGSGKEIIFIELMRSDRKLEATRDGWK